ncbi:MAG: ABC transporter permease [Acidobacteriota bacterium]
MRTLVNAIRQLLRDLKSQRLRTLLTVFGIVWGTVAISLLLAFGTGLQEQMRKSMAGLGDHIVIAWPSRTSIPYDGMGKGRQINLTERDIQLISKQAQGLQAISSEYASNMLATLGDKSLRVQVSGVSPVFSELRSLIPQGGGRFIDPMDMKQRRRVAFVGNQLALDLFGKKNPVGQTFELNGSPFLVVGTMRPKDQDSSYRGRDKNALFVPGTTMVAMTGNQYVSDFIYRAVNPQKNKELTHSIIGILAGKFHFDPKDKEALMIWDTTEMFAFMDAFMFGFKVFLGILGALTLIVGGIGVSNIMNVVVEERTREIGIKMALGARKRIVLSQFLVETLLLTAAGGLIGLLISWAVCASFPSLGLTDYVGNPTISPVVAAVTAVVLGLVGVLAGFLPARDAASLDPVIAMKL